MVQTAVKNLKARRSSARASQCKQDEEQVVQSEFAELVELDK